jgi:mono/diheme cytochrome c family protein
MKQQVTLNTILLLLATCATPAAGQDIFPAVLQPLLETHCIKCHGKKKKAEGDINLFRLSSSRDLLRTADLLPMMIKVIENGDMPPEDEPTLKPATRAAMLAHLKAISREAAGGRGYSHTPIHRMNRFQYNNAVVDLLDLDRDIFALPEKLMRRYTDYFDPALGTMPAEVRVQNRPLGKDVDNARQEGFSGVGPFPQDLRAEHGYDNQADHLTLSPLLMESFLRLSHSIVESRDLRREECGSWDSFFTLPADNGSEDASLNAQVRIIRERLGPFLRRAFRMPIDPSTLDRFVAFAERELRSGASFTDTMKTLVGATIASPDFLYLYSTATAKKSGPGRRHSFDLASRLSFFLWGSIPDDTLLDLAEAGTLSDPAVLSSQVDRMLNDHRVIRFCDTFPGQWLQLDRLISSIPDNQKFPYFYFQSAYRASMHMMLEPLLLFETVYLEDRSVMDLLDPDFSWQSDVLRDAYLGQVNRRDVQVLTFKRIPMTDPRWGGVVTNAAVMTMTSSPVRTTPITRGAWLNAVIFNDPPEPPPADVPPLPEADEETLAKLTLRERFEEHRKRADCAACHRTIDPLGFALENYGPTGLWREKYENGRKVDPSGTLFNTHEFTTAIQFKEVLLKEKQRFVRGFAAHLLSYSLSRELDAADDVALDKITARAMAGEDSLRDLMKMITLSDPFKNPGAR